MTLELRGVESAWHELDDEAEFGLAEWRFDSADDSVELPIAIRSPTSRGGSGVTCPVATISSPRRSSYRLRLVLHSRSNVAGRAQSG